jgi:predicted TIM-barrel fold metal-dependent hydrolase
MVEGIEVLDGHMHVFTAGYDRWARRNLEARDERYQEAFQQWSQGFRQKYNSDLGEQTLDPPEKLARLWAEELDRCGVDRAVFVSLYPEDEELTTFLHARPRRFLGFVTVDPRDPQAPALLRRRVREEGYVGLKLYPTTQGYLPSDRNCYPVYEEAQALRIPILFHLGITLMYESDLRFANPIELHPVLKDFPDVAFVVAHFGAGYFREVLFLAYHVNNLYLDTSGKNIWVNYLPYPLDLEQAFRKSLDVLGARRIIYGSDSRMLTRGYRRTVLEEQLRILKCLELDREQISLIMGGNMTRLLEGREA